MTTDYNRIVITKDMLAGSQADFLSECRASIAGHRPRCSCQPILAYPDGPVVGYYDLCDEHKEVDH